MHSTGRCLGIVAIGVGVGFLLFAGQAVGALLIEYQDGEVGHEFSGWQSGAEWSGTGSGDGSPEAALAGTSFLTVDPSAQGIGVQDMDYFRTDAFSTDVSGMTGISFDFYASGEGGGVGAPARMGAYFYSAEDSTYWLYEIADTAISDGWNTYSFEFSSGSWTSYTDADYWAFNSYGAPTADQLTNVTEIGFSVAYLEDNDIQTYGVDKFGLSLTVPEPETYLVLGMALLSVAVVFRKRISDSLAEARAMMHS